MEGRDNVSCWKSVYWCSVKKLFLLSKQKQGERQPRPQLTGLTREVISLQMVVGHDLWPLWSW